MNLSEYKKIKIKILKLMERQKEIEAKYSLQAQQYSSDVHGGIPLTLEDMLIQKEEINQEILKLEEKAKKIEKDFFKLSLKMENQTYAEILDYYYFSHLSIRAIAHKLNYSERHTRRLLKQAENYVRTCPLVS